MSDALLREALCALGRSLFERGLTHGSTGNLSVALTTASTTPTDARRALDPARLSLLDADGVHAWRRADQGGAAAFAMYRQRPRDCAVVHLHSVSGRFPVLAVDRANVAAAHCLHDADRHAAAAAVPRPDQLADARSAGRHHALLLANHGPVVSGSSLSAAADAVEELEATAKLWLLVRHERVRALDAAQVAEITARYLR
jgi:ribulose-5-phosphate 4-epimerase/fuculose-1-phosphate aldolase